MAITFPLAFPTITNLTSVRFIALSAVAVTRSPFTFAHQVQVQPGRIWQAEVALPAMKRAKAETWLSFLLKLNGAEGTFLMGDPLGATARGSASSTPGTPVVMGADQTGGTLVIDGLPVSTTGYLLAGDYIQLGSSLTARLYKVLEDVNSDSAGEATIEIWPDLRSSPGDNAAIIVDSCVSLFRLGGNATSWDLDVAEFYGLNFSAFEAI